MSLSLHCWLQGTFLGPGQDSGASQSTKLSGTYLGLLAEKAKTLMVSSADSHSPRPWGKGGTATSLTLFLAHLFLSSPTVLFPPSRLSSSPCHLSILLSLTTVPLGFFLTFILNFLTSLSPLLSHLGPALALSVRLPVCFLVISTIISAHRAEGGEMITTHDEGGTGMISIHFSLSRGRHCCHFKMGKQNDCSRLHLGSGSRVPTGVTSHPVPQNCPGGGGTGAWGR